MTQADELRHHAAAQLTDLILITTTEKNIPDLTRTCLDAIDAIAVYTIALYQQTHPDAPNIPD